MPELCRFYGIIITMYRELGGRHHYPHIHTQHGDFKAVFNLPEGEVMEGELPRKETRLVQAWIELHLPELMDNWHRLNISEGVPSFSKIAPL